MPRRVPTIGITLRVELTRAGLQDACDYLVRVNRRYLRRNPKTPPLSAAGIRYSREKWLKEKWQSIPEMLKSKKADCEDLAAYFVAFAQEKGIDARCKPEENRDGNWHIVARFPGGKIVDPSAHLGM